jgi:hypothetical protein
MDWGLVYFVSLFLIHINLYLFHILLSLRICTPSQLTILGH